jgi:hypothetical protein
MAESKKPGESLAPALGIMIIQWGVLETTVSAAMSYMLELQSPHDAIVCGNVDFREKLEIIRSSGFAIRHDDKWHERLEKCIERIDSNLRPRRNAMVHHSWGKEGFLENPRPKLKRPQAFQRILEKDKTPMSYSDVYQLTCDICDEIVVLLNSLDALKKHRAARRQP